MTRLLFVSDSLELWLVCFLLLFLCFVVWGIIGVKRFVEKSFDLILREDAPIKRFDIIKASGNNQYIVVKVKEDGYFFKATVLPYKEQKLKVTRLFWWTTVRFLVFLEVI